MLLVNKYPLAWPGDIYLTFYIFMKKSLAKCDCSGYNRCVEATKKVAAGLVVLPIPQKPPIQKIRAQAH